MPRLMRSTGELRNAIINSWLGLKTVWAGEVAFRQYVVIGALLVPVAIYFGEDALERLLMLLTILLVLIVEIINTAIEAVVDRISVEQHPLSAAAKDLGSAAVFLCVVAFLLTWVLILFD